QKRRLGFLCRSAWFASGAAQHETVDPEEVRAALSDPDRTLSSRYGKVMRAEWVEGLLTELGYETKRLPRQLQGSLLAREKRAVPGDDETDAFASDKAEPKWWALQVRSVHGQTWRKRPGVRVARSGVSADLGIVVTNPEKGLACALHLDSVKLSVVRSDCRNWLRFSMPSLPCVAEGAGRAYFLLAFQDALRRLPVRTQREWLTQLPGNV
ncbi:unnamed protein product, partial [Amoebophrya sp. A25]